MTNEAAKIAARRRVLEWTGNPADENLADEVLRVYFEALSSLLKPEGQRTKLEEWEACYALLLSQLNSVVEENIGLKAALSSACPSIPGEMEAILAEALEWYADKENYKPDYGIRKGGDVLPKICREGVKRARAALAKYRANQGGNNL